MLWLVSTYNYDLDFMAKHIDGSTRKRAQRSSVSHVSNQSRQSAKFSMAWLCGRWRWGDGSLIPASSKRTLENKHQLLMLHLFCNNRINLRNKWDMLTWSACGVGDPAHTQHDHTVFWGVSILVFKLGTVCTVLSKELSLPHRTSQHCQNICVLIFTRPARSNKVQTIFIHY